MEIFIAAGFIITILWALGGIRQDLKELSAKVDRLLDAPDFKGRH